MNLYTSRLFNVNAADLGPLDVTRKSGTDGLIWSPSWDILSPALKAFKAARTAAEKNNAFVVYAIAFKGKMRESWRTRHAEWERLLRRETLTLQCYCVDAGYCHRTLLARDILPGACARLGIDYVFGGEL